jgi:glutamyl-tRNA(Gln) amidotransferase subunit E
LAKGMTVYGVRLNGFKDLLRWQTQTNTTFSQEISDRVRVIACLTTLPNMVHSDSPGEALTSAEWQMAKKTLNTGDEDALVIVWGPEVDAKLGAQEVIIRAKEATIGVPSETRQALKDGTNGFERILPGPNRMYPDTDLPPKSITTERLERIRAKLPPYIMTRERWYKEIGVPADLIQFLSVSPFANLFERCANDWDLSPKLVSVVLVQYPKRLKKKGLPVEKLNEETLEAVLKAVKEGKIFKEGLLPLLEQVLASGKNPNEFLLPKATERELRESIEQVVMSLKNKKFAGEESRMRRAMGLLMEKWRGRMEGTDAALKLSLFLKEGKL